MSILGKIKKGVASSGSNKGKLLYFKPDSKVRIRFLQEIEDGQEVVMHDSFDRGINVICRHSLGEDECDYCDDETLRTRPSYVWSVWDHDAKEVKLFMGFANNFSPLPSVIAMYESYGTIMDRDYVIQQDGSGTNKRFGVVPMDKAKFKNTKAKAYSAKKLLEILDKAFPSDATEDDDEDDKPTKGKKKGKNKHGNTPGTKSKSKKKKVEEPEEEEWDEEEENEYSDMSLKELYSECIDRDLKAKKKQDKDYYIDLLLADDLDDEEDEDEEDDDEEENDYSEMSAKDLYLECIERGITKAKKKQKAEYYIDLLEADDLEDEDEDEEDEDDGW